MSRSRRWITRYPPPVGWFRGRREGSSLDVSDYTVETKFCEECQQHYVRVTGYVSRDETALAAYYAVCHGHPDHEVALDVILGTWGVEEAADHETFSCLIRPEGAMAVDPFVTLSLDPAGDLPGMLGRPVRRSDALQHPRIGDVWAIVDALVVHVPPVAEQYNAR